MTDAREITTPDAAADRFAELAARYFDNQLDDAGLEEFRRLMETPAHRDLFVSLCIQARLVNEAFTPQLNDDAEIREVVPTGRWRLGRVGWLSVAAAIVLMASVLIIMQRSASRDESSQPVKAGAMAMITDLSEAQWDQKQGAVTLGADLPRGPLNLLAGRAQIMMHSGAVVDMIGPCSFELTSENRGLLHSGRITAHVPTRAHGFTVDAPDLRVVDLGTEFGIIADKGRPTQVHVFLGRVMVDFLNTASVEPLPVQLVAHQSLTFDADHRDVRMAPAAPWRFVTHWRPVTPRTMATADGSSLTFVAAQVDRSDTPLADGCNTFPALGDDRFVLPAGAPPFESNAMWNYREDFGQMGDLMPGVLHGWSKTGTLMQLTTRQPVAAGRYEVYVVYMHRVADANVDDPGGVSAALDGHPLMPFDQRNGRLIAQVGDWAWFAGRLGEVEGDELLIDVGRSHSGKGDRTVYAGLAYRAIENENTQPTQ
ncbi:MAG: hypothetical protein GC162_18990 [Planctomycetes bacterium]|nr:hypothetical protein [Planctomycetota bacterium]